MRRNTASLYRHRAQRVASWTGMCWTGERGAGERPKAHREPQASLNPSKLSSTPQEARRTPARNDISSMTHVSWLVYTAWLNRSLSRHPALLLLLLLLFKPPKSVSATTTHVAVFQNQLLSGRMHSLAPGCLLAGVCGGTRACLCHHHHSPV